MKRFPCAHATHATWQVAAEAVLEQLRLQMGTPDYAQQPNLAVLYLSDGYASHAHALLDYLSAALPLVTDWCGTVSSGIMANSTEYVEEPALALLLLEVPADQFRVFSGVSPLGLGFEAHNALVHADGNLHDLGELVQEMAQRTDSHYLFGGVSSSRNTSVQFALAGDGFINGYGAATGVFHGGISGVAFTSAVGMVSKLTQGCKPISKQHTITQAQHNLVLSLDGMPALDVLLADLDLSIERIQDTLDAVRSTMAGLSQDGHSTQQNTGYLASDTVVRRIIGLDIGRRGIALAEQAHEGMGLVFCQRNTGAARSDLVRVCSEIREELDASRPMLGAIYISCVGRGGAYFGSPNAELQLVRKALGDVPLVGFFANGELAFDRLHSYAGVLTVFTG